MLLPSVCYHIYNHANGDDNLFRERENYRFFLQQYQKHIAPAADTLAYCLMPNHFHLLIRIKLADDLLQIFLKFETLEKLCSSNILSKQVANLFSSYTRAFNKRYHRRGSLFIKNFKRKEVKSDDYFDRVVTYIHLNPIKHRFVSSIKDWEWTSFHDYQHTQPSLVQRAPVLNSLGSLEQFNIFHQAMTDVLATISTYIAAFEHDGKEFES